ncbi:MAG: response regulator [Acidobacteriia bacterium]|nr:response regulator [Terriglobia bacterium]
MWVFDLSSEKFLAINKAACGLYGYSPEEFQKLTLSGIVGNEEARRLVSELKRKGSAVNLWRHHTRSGRLIEVETSVHEIPYRRRRAGLAVLIDVTERRRLEEQLRQAQKMEAVGMLAGGVAHDFNNLLTIITGYSQLILNNLRENDPNRHSAEQIMKAGERAGALTKQLLAFSRRQVLQPKVLDLNMLVKTLSAMLQRLIGEDIELRLVLSPDLGRVYADPGQLEQVIMNLVVNARDAMAAGGMLTIRTANAVIEEGPEGGRLATKPGPHVLLAVSDTGHGMDERTRNRLFEPFFTTKSVGRGTGLGLSTVFGIVKQSGGSLNVESAPGRGTIFEVYLPRIEQPLAVEEEKPKESAPRGTETILLVEDDEMVRSLVRETLRREGYKVIDAPDPIEACRLAENYKGEIHLLISDIVMPKLNGRDLAVQITQLRPGTKVLFMSGYAETGLVKAGINERAEFLQKPFTPGALAEKVRKVLEGDSNRANGSGRTEVAS